MVGTCLRFQIEAAHGGHDRPHAHSVRWNCQQCLRTLKFVFDGFRFVLDKVRNRQVNKAPIKQRTEQVGRTPGEGGIDIVERGMLQWQAERPDIDCSGKAIIGRILRLQGVVLKNVDTALKPFNLKYPAYAVLATLRVCGGPCEMSPGELTRTVLLSSGGISNLLARLENDGYIVRINSKKDRREVIVRLTEAGKALVDPAMEAHARAERELIQTFSNEDAGQLGDLLSSLLVAHEGTV